MAKTKKKSHAQIERMKKRAAARGDVYEPPATTNTVTDDSAMQSGGARTSAENPTIDASASSSSKTTISSNDTTKAAVAKRLLEEIRLIESNSDLKAKDRRSAKRKAEAIAAEDAGCPATELLEWFKEHQEQGNSISENEEKKREDDGDAKLDDEQAPDDPFHQQNGRNPYVVFVGQLSYTTTKEQLLEHIRAMLGDEHVISENTVRIRLLTDAKTQKSRGMAFVQVSNPEVLYACLKLHKTLLNGRRINVERTTGGKQHSEARQAKLKTFREEQEQYMSQLVDKLLKEYRDKGELAENELDEGVIKLLKRHSGQVAHAALEQYVESKGRDMDNPSAYLSFLVGKVAEEMLEQMQQQQLKTKTKKNDKTSTDTSRKRKLDDKPADRESKSSSKLPLNKSSKLASTSELAKSGVDLSVSEPSNEDVPLAKIFPSMSRGRGRGRSL